MNTYQQQQNQQAAQGSTQLPPHCCVLPEARLSYAHIYKPEPDLNGNPKFQCTFLLPKATTDLSDINRAIQHAIANGVEKKWNGIQPMNLNLPLKDGDMYAAQKPDKRQMYVGMWYIKSSENPEFGQPVVMDEHRVRSNNPQDVQSGDYGIGVVEFIPFDNRGSQGVTAVPKVIRKTRTGERFGGGVEESTAVAAVGGVADPTVGAAQQQYQQPPQQYQQPPQPPQQYQQPPQPPQPNVDISNLI